MQHRYFDLSEVRLHAVEAGEGKPLILLHGFPEFWLSWRHQIPYFAERGFRVVAVDMRGYNLSSKPDGIGAYSVERVASDISELARQLGGRPIVVGHDWGGVITWRLARSHADDFEKFVILNIPHPQALRRELRNPSQAIRFWYQFAMRVPILGEAALRFRGFALLRRAMQRLTHEHLSDELLDRYVDAWGQPGALHATVNYYRAIGRQRPSKSAAKMTPCDVPVMVIWGDRDQFVNARAFTSSPEFMPALRLERIPGAGHFVHQDEPEKVNVLIDEFATSRDASLSGR